jgi:hypothetical protein
VPACFICNSKKRELLLSDGILGIHLASIKSRLSDLKTALDAKRQERDLDATLRAIARSIDAGKFKLADLVGRIELLQSVPHLDDTSNIIWTKHALVRAGERQIAAADVLAALRKADPARLKGGHRADSYWLQTAPQGDSPGLRVAFKVAKDNIVILTVVWRDR